MVVAIVDLYDVYNDEAQYIVFDIHKNIESIAILH